MKKLCGTYDFLNIRLIITHKSDYKFNIDLIIFK